MRSSGKKKRGHLILLRKKSIGRSPNNRGSLMISSIRSNTYRLRWLMRRHRSEVDTTGE